MGDKVKPTTLKSICGGITGGGTEKSALSGGSYEDDDDGKAKATVKEAGKAPEGFKREDIPPMKGCSDFLEATPELALSMGSCVGATACGAAGSMVPILGGNCFATCAGGVIGFLGTGLSQMMNKKK